MHLLRSVQRDLRVIGVGRDQAMQKHPFNRRNVLAVLILSLATISCIIQLIYVADTFLEYTAAIYSSPAMGIATLILFGATLKIRSLFDCLDQLENIINERLKFQASSELYEYVDPQVEKFSELIMSGTMKILAPTVMFSKFIISFATYLTTDLGNDAFELPFPYWFPFDWKNPMGYLVAFSIEYIFIMDLYFFVACCVSAGIGIYFWACWVIKDIKNNFNSLNENAKFDKIQPELSKQLYTTVHLHSIAKQLLRDTSKLVQPIFMILFTWSIVTISVAMIILKMEIANHNSNNLMMLVVPIFQLCCAFGLVFLSCEFCGRICYKTDEINDVVDQFDWYLFPIQMQKSLPMILNQAQQAVHFECFGSIPCDRETFKRVCIDFTMHKVTNSAFSFFMVLRQFGI